MMPPPSLRKRERERGSRGKVNAHIRHFEREEKGGMEKRTPIFANGFRKGEGAVSTLPAGRV